ncbi:hypothetical protein D3C86_1532790 [compost metagenome]
MANKVDENIKRLTGNRRWFDDMGEKYPTMFRIERITLFIPLLRCFDRSELEGLKTNTRCRTGGSHFLSCLQGNVSANIRSDFSREVVMSIKNLTYVTPLKLPFERHQTRPALSHVNISRTPRVVFVNNIDEPWE